MSDQILSDRQFLSLIYKSISVMIRVWQYPPSNYQEAKQIYGVATPSPSPVKVKVPLYRLRLPVRCAILV